MSNQVINPSAPATGFGLLMSPQTIEQVQTFCLMLSKTEFVPKAFRGKPDSIMVVGAMGARLGVDVFSAMAGIADINGRPSVYGDLMLAVCQNHPAFEDCLQAYEGKPYEDEFAAVCTVKRKGRAPVVGRFSVVEAKEAKLWKKAGPWENTPQRMLMMRARAFALRDAFSDALAGFHSKEEMEDAGAIDVTATATIHDEPKAGKARKALPDHKPGVTTGGDVSATCAGDVVREFGATDEFGVVSTALPAEQEPPNLITVTDCKARVAELWKTPDGKKLVKDHLATWKLTGVEQLGEMEPDEPGRFLAKLNEIVAINDSMRGASK